MYQAERGMAMKNKIVMLLVLITGSLMNIHATGIEDASKAYNSGDYATAIEIYRTLEHQYGTSASLLYDMGQAYVRAGNLGNAMLCYQRSLRLNPYNGNARANIRYVESKVSDANRAEMKGKKLNIDAEDPSFFSSIRRYITERNSPDLWGLLGGISFVLLCGCVALYIFTHGVMWRKIGFFGGGVMLCLSVIFVIFSFMGASACQKHDVGVIISYKVELRAEPSTSAKTVAAPLTQGTVMTVMQVENDAQGRPEWYKVRLNSDYAGWLRNDVFEPI